MNIIFKYLERIFQKTEICLWSWRWNGRFSGLAPSDFLCSISCKTALCQRTQRLLRPCFPFKQLWRVLGISSLELKAVSSGFHPFVLMLVLGVQLASLNPCCHCTLHLCEDSSYIPSESSCLQMIPPQFLDFSSCDRLSWPTSYAARSHCSNPSTGGTPQTEPQVWSDLCWVYKDLVVPDTNLPEYSPGLG